jgi:hypothetical protein
VTLLLGLIGFGLATGEYGPMWVGAAGSPVLGIAAVKRRRR